MTRPRQHKTVDILVSGRGTNMEALIRAASEPDYPATIARVISSRSDARALQIASSLGISTLALDYRDYADRAAHEAALIEALEENRPDLICLAGYMRILSTDVVRRYRGRMLNIHPSLLPAFPGIDTHERAVNAGVRIHGATVHFVTETVDDGPIVAQAAVAVRMNETPQQLAERVLRQENLLYPHALRLVATGQVRMSGGRSVFSSSQSAEDAEDCGIISPALPQSAC